MFEDILHDGTAQRVRTSALDMDDTGALRAAGVGRDAASHRSIRGDLIAWLDPCDLPEALAPVIRMFEDLMQALNETAYLGARTLECQLAVYHPGYGYERHRDVTSSASSRRATAIYYANDWQPGDGGELEVWEAAGSRLLAPQHDRLVVFRSECTEHAVRTVTGPRRVAVSAFMHNESRGSLHPR